MAPTKEEGAFLQEASNLELEEKNSNVVDDLELEDLDNSELDNLLEDEGAFLPTEKKVLNVDVLQDYKNATNVMQELKELYAVKETEFNETNKELLQKLAAIGSEINAKKQILVELAETEFNETKQKSLLGGLSVRVTTKLIYTSEAALNWANANMPIIIKKVIETKTFEKFAKTSDLDFVQKQEKVTICFPKEIVFDEAK
jgi:hypothetical protein